MVAMVIIGVDPHKSTHTATAIDPQTNRTVASVRIDASLVDYRRLLRWAGQFDHRRWAVENAEGLGRHLSSWLLARGEDVVDVPSAATARVRQLSRGGGRKKRSDRGSGSGLRGRAARRRPPTPGRRPHRRLGLA
jgi:transposase